jgi:hypothetical protein
VHENGELVGAEPRRLHALAAQAARPLRDLAQQLISAAAPPPVVEHAEPVEIEMDDRRGALVLAHRAGQPIGEFMPVDQTRQRVVMGEIGDMGFRLEPRGDVLKGQADRELPLLVGRLLRARKPRYAGDEFQRDARAARALDPELALRLGAPLSGERQPPRRRQLLA